MMGIFTEKGIDFKSIKIKKQQYEKSKSKASHSRWGAGI